MKFRIIYQYGYEDVDARNEAEARAKAEPTIITGPVEKIILRRPA